MVGKAHIYRLVQKSYGMMLGCIETCFGIDSAKKLDVRLRFGKHIDLKNPRTLADKVSYISLHTLPDSAVRCTDKWDARGYVAEKGLSHILIPVYGLPVSNVDQLDFHAFPNRFVLKATHGCRMNYICLDKSGLNMEHCRQEVQRWLDTTYGTYSVEPHYRKIPHRVYCEAYIGEPDELVDYKIHCLNGEPAFILACRARKADAGEGSSVSMYLYDLEWNPIDGLQNYRGHGPGQGSISRPERLAEMLNISRELSREFDFVRVDLYETEGRIWFGELTFTPANGVFPSYKQELLETQGKKLRISNE